MRIINKLLTAYAWKMSWILGVIDFRNKHAHRELLIAGLVGMSLVTGIISAPMTVGIGIFAWVCSKLVDKN